MIPLYILGLLQRYGPQHGYQIKKIIGEELADFTQIKLPTIYYHLEKMKSDGLVDAASEKPGSRPEKTVYAVTEKGRLEFERLLGAALEIEYRPVFPSDAVFFFSDRLGCDKIRPALETHIKNLKMACAALEAHKNAALRLIPEAMRLNAEIIFSHHARHLNAELGWAEETLLKYREEQ